MIGPTEINCDLVHRTPVLDQFFKYYALISGRNDVK